MSAISDIKSEVYENYFEKFLLKSTKLITEYTPNFMKYLQDIKLKTLKHLYKSLKHLYSKQYGYCRVHYMCKQMYQCALL